MIGQNEIKAKAIEFDILHPNVERDYVFGWLLKSFYENDYGLFTRERYACLNQQRRGICDNGRTITREKIEQRVLAGLKERLVSADAVGEVIGAYTQETSLAAPTTAMARSLPFVPPDQFACVAAIKKAK
ncbi:MULTISPECIES: hypothetical protein [unclassified Mesorhizobium]|uniref:hypothetical protein n=1 Tax=unclassified Mesorhizobium TaxID=325217 RepID=UPI00333B761F